jgi:hypothetical protein
MPAGFEFPHKVDLWLPVGPLFAESSWQKRDNHPGLFGLARLKPGVTLERARTDLDVIAVRLEQQYPESNKTRRVQIDRLLDNKVGNVRRALWILLGAVSFVLVIACANVANLFAPRGGPRERNGPARGIGSGPMANHATIAHGKQLAALLGAATGLLFAKGALRVVTPLPASMPRAAEIGLDPRVLLFSPRGGAHRHSALPQLGTRRVNLQGTLKEAGRGATSSRAGLRQGLVIAEVALTFVLLVGAGLLLLSFHRLLQVNPGFG